MNKTNLVIIGSSGHAKVVIDIFEKQGGYTIIGLLDDYRKVNEITLGYKVLGGLSAFEKLNKINKNLAVFVAIGDNWSRQKVVDILLSYDENTFFPSAVHPSAIIGKGTVIGKGVAIMANVVVNSDSNIGDFSFLNTKASADHDAVLEHFSSIGPNVTLGGNVSIGAYTSVSIGATTKEKVSIGKHSIIGAGSLLLSNCPDNVIMYGVPAKVIRERKVGEKYM